MNTPAKTSRTNLAIQVFQETNKGLTVCQACKAVGLPRSSFYYIVRKNPEVFIEFQEAVKASELAQLVKILSSQLDILNKTIEDALAKATSPRVRLAIAKFLFDRVLDLMDKHMKTTSNKPSAKDILTGPVQKHIESRIRNDSQLPPYQA